MKLKFILLPIIICYCLHLWACNQDTKEKSDKSWIETTKDSVSTEPLVPSNTTISTNSTSGQKIPSGYKLFEKIEGDLNGDSIPDKVLIIKEINDSNIVVNRFDKTVDRNRRGILIYLTTNAGEELVTKNLSCFSSENEDGGIYFAPDLSVYIKNAKLYVHYHHGRYGYWKYTFRYQNSDFELIGYDGSSNFGPITMSETSINYLTKRKKTRVNVNQNTEDGGDEEFEEHWESITLEELIKLSEILNFDNFNNNEVD